MASKASNTHLVSEGETSKAALKAVSTAIRRWGVPQRLLSDNGLAFNPTRTRRELLKTTDPTTP